MTCTERVHETHIGRTALSCLHRSCVNAASCDLAKVDGPYETYEGSPVSKGSMSEALSVIVVVRRTHARCRCPVCVCICVRCRHSAARHVGRGSLGTTRLARTARKDQGARGAKLLAAGAHANRIHGAGW